MEDSHWETWKSENWVSEHEKAWERWAADLERTLGHDIDGDGPVNGYSLDECYDWWEDGLTVELVVARIQSRPNYDPEA